MKVFTTPGSRKFAAFGFTSVLLLVFLAGSIWAKADVALVNLGVYGLLGALGLFTGGNEAEHFAGARAAVPPTP
jgi:hypothetical protein